MSTRSPGGWFLLPLPALALAVVLCPGPAYGADSAAAMFSRGWPGVVAPLKTIDVAATSPGKVKRLFQLPGDTVQAAKPVAQLELRALRQDLAKSDAALDAARADRQRARLRFERFEAKRERLARVEDLISRDELAQARLEAEQAATELESAGAVALQRQQEVAQLASAIAESTLRAPFDATVAVRWVEEGAVVAAGESIVRLISTSAVRLRFAVPAAEAGRFDASRELYVDTGDGGPAILARTLRIAPSIDLATQMIFVEAEFAVADTGLRTGASVWVSHGD